MYTIVYTKYIWTQVSLVTDIWMDNYKYIWQDDSFYSLASNGQELHFNNSYDYKKKKENHPHLICSQTYNADSSV